MIPFPSITTVGSLPPATVRRFTTNMSSRRAYRQNSLLFCTSLCSAINSLAPHVHKCKNQNVCSKKRYVLHQYLHQMFKVYIPTIHLLWTCLNTHYLNLSKVIPSITIIGSSCGTTSAPKKRNFPSSAQLQRRPSAPLEKNPPPSPEHLSTCNVPISRAKI